MIRVTADSRTVLSIDAKATIADSRFYAGRVADRVNVGQVFLGPVATIQDLNPTGGLASDYTASINWGNGTTTVGTVRYVAPGKLEVIGRNLFDTVGTKTVTVTITSVGSGKTATAASIFTVAPMVSVASVRKPVVLTP